MYPRKTTQHSNCRLITSNYQTHLCIYVFILRKVVGELVIHIYSQFSDQATPIVYLITKYYNSRLYYCYIDYLIILLSSGHIRK